MNDLAEEALAKWLETTNHRIYGHQRSFLDGFKAGALAERERCAKVCEEVAEYASTVIVDEAERRSAQACAEAIRNASDIDKPSEAQQLGGDLWGGGRF